MLLQPLFLCYVKHLQTEPSSQPQTPGSLRMAFPHDAVDIFVNTYTSLHPFGLILFYIIQSSFVQ